MAYIFGVILFLILFIVMHFFTEMTLKQKLYATGIFALLTLGAYLYNYKSEERRLHLEEVMLKFNSGDNIICNSVDVNNTEFSYSSGTQTFLGKKESKMYGRIISLDSCQ
jgi:hypothetical protein